MQYSPKSYSPEKVKAASEEMMRLGRSNATERAKYDRLKEEAQELLKIANKYNKTS